MTANINPRTGIAYGYISANALRSYLINELLYGEGVRDWSCREADGEVVEGVYEGVTYLSSWLGGALNFFISESPYTTDKARLASPCVPNAGILDVLDGSVTSYDVPPDWRMVDEG